MSSRHRKSPADQVSKNIEYRVRSLRRMLRAGILSEQGVTPIDRRLRLIKNRRRLLPGRDSHTTGRSRTRTRSQSTQSQREDDESSEDESDDSEADVEDESTEELKPWERERQMKQGSKDTQYTTASTPSMSEAAGN